MGWFYLVLGVGVLAVIGWYGWTRRQMKRGRAEELEALYQAVLEDIVLFKHQVEQLPVVASSSEYDRVREAYDFAVRASGLKNPGEATAITRELAEGQYAVLRYEAAVAGEPPPERRVPCFFNPQHGPSAIDVQWTEPGRGTRRLPACAQDAANLKVGRDPVIRYVERGNHRVPYWTAGALFAPYGAGYFTNSTFLLTNFTPQDTHLYGSPRHRTGPSPYPLEPPN